MLLDFHRSESRPCVPLCRALRWINMFGILCLKYSFFKSQNLTASPFTLQNFIMSDISRNDEWNSDRPQEERKYDGPAGMDPDGVIDSNWDEVNDYEKISVRGNINYTVLRSVRTSMT